MRLMRALISIVILTVANIVNGITISNVSHDQQGFLPEQKESVKISFVLDEPASITLSIFDSREIRIRRIDSAGWLAKGENTIEWDGLDQAGRIVPSEAYHYTLQAFSKEGESIEYDPTDITRGETTSIKQIHWDKKNQELTFTTSATSRIRLRIGLGSNGPLIRTLLNWVPRVGGKQVVKWDGFDEDGVVDLSNHPARTIGVQVFTLSSNIIIAGLPTEQPEYIQGMSWPIHKRKVKHKARRKMFAYQQYSTDSIGDFPIILTTEHKLKHDKNKLPIVNGKIALRLDVPDLYRARVAAQRFETVFYIDGEFIGEGEIGSIPMTWHWDPKGINPGVHYITANIRSYEGNFGTQTLKINYQPEQ